MKFLIGMICGLTLAIAVPFALAMGPAKRPSRKPKLLTPETNTPIEILKQPEPDKLIEVAQ
jgi:hypothetical protein